MQELGAKSTDSCIKWIHGKIVVVMKSHLIISDNHNDFDLTWTKKNNWTLGSPHLREARSNRRYDIDEILANEGYDVLRLPPYHCQYNPVKMVLGFCETYNKNIQSHFPSCFVFLLVFCILLTLFKFSTWFLLTFRFQSFLYLWLFSRGVCLGVDSQWGPRKVFSCTKPFCACLNVSTSDIGTIYSFIFSNLHKNS